MLTLLLPALLLLPVPALAEEETEPVNTEAVTVYVAHVTLDNGNRADLEAMDSAEAALEAARFWVQSVGGDSNSLVMTGSQTSFMGADVIDADPDDPLSEGLTVNHYQQDDYYGANLLQSQTVSADTQSTSLPEETPVSAVSSAGEKVTTKAAAVQTTVLTATAPAADREEKIVKKHGSLSAWIPKAAFGLIILGTVITVLALKRKKP